MGVRIMYETDGVQIFQALDPHFGPPWVPLSILQQPVS